jgi:hypothetical protein
VRSGIGPRLVRILRGGSGCRASMAGASRWYDLAQVVDRVLCGPGGPRQGDMRRAGPCISGALPLFVRGEEPCRHQTDPGLRLPLGRPALPRQGNRYHGNEVAARRAITEPTNWASRWSGHSCRPRPPCGTGMVAVSPCARPGRGNGPVGEPPVRTAVLPEPMAPARRPASHRVQRPCPASVGTGSALSRNSPSMRACSAW